MRVLCCLLLGSSVLLSGCGESKEAAAVAAIENMGGEVGFEGKLLSKPVSVHLSGRRVTDTGLVHLKGLTSLRHLDLSGARMTDTGLVHLKGMTSLSSLNLSGTKVTDAGLIHLKSMTNLTNLILPRTKVTTAGVKDLQSSLPKCSIFQQSSRIPAVVTTKEPSGTATSDKEPQPTNESNKDAVTPSTKLDESAKLDSQILSTDWPQSGFGTAQTRFNPHERTIGPTNVGDLEVLWSNRHGSSIRGFVSIIGETAYYGDYGGEFRAVEAATGQTVWKERLQGKHQGHAIVGGVAYVTSINRLYAFDAVTGKMLWTKAADSGHFGGPTVADGILYVGTNSPPTTHALDASSGNELWSNVPGGGTAIADGVLYRSSAETLQALDARTGSILWEVSIEEGELIGPVVSGDVVYVHSTVGKLYAFDARDRKAQDRSPLWVGKTAIQTNGDGPRLPAVGNGKIFVGANSTFYAFEAAAGEESERNPVWTAKVEAPFFASAPSVANGVVYSAAGNHDIYAFDAATGEVLWNYRTRGREYPLRSSPTIVNGRLFHADTFGFTLYAFHIPETTGRTPSPAKDRDTPILKKSSGAVTSDEQPKTVNESKDAAVATIEALGGKVTFGLRNPGKPVVGISLHSTEVTDAGLEHLKGMTSLASLDLCGTKVTDVGLKHIKDLTSLKKLRLINTQVTDTGLEHLKGMTSLASLDLTDTEVTDAGLEHLKELTNMQVLGLNRTKVTDAGLMNLKGMTSLQVLVLASTEVTDAGLIHLKRLTNLKKLYLDRTKVTDAGVKDLQTALPKCRISK